MLMRGVALGWRGVRFRRLVGNVLVRTIPILRVTTAPSLMWFGIRSAEVSLDTTPRV